MAIRTTRKAQSKTVVRSNLLPKGVDREKLLQLLPYMTEEEKQEIDQLISPQDGEIYWLPLPGPQTKAFYSQANMLLYGGAAGGGKTDLLLGLAYYRHHRSIIFRREYTNLTGIMDRAQEMYSDYGDYNGFFRRWTFRDREGHILEYGAAENVGSETKFQGRAHDAKLFDEGPQFTYPQFNYLRGWNRATSSTPRGQLLQTVVTCNPPQSVDQRWITIPWGPWLDKSKWPKGSLPGEVLYFITQSGEKFIPVEGPGIYRKKGLNWVRTDHYQHGDLIGLGYTFIPSSLKDNPYLDDGQYASVLQSLPEPLRSQLLFGDFQAGVSDDPWQLFPTAWIEAAVQRWKQQYGGKPPAGMFMSQLGVDVARGGQDRTVLSPRYGKFYDTQKVYKGFQTKDGMAVAGLVVQCIKPNTVVQVDAIGIGSSPVDWLRSQKVHTIAFIASARSEETDRSGYLHFANKRAEAFWKFRESLDPQLNTGIAIPDDPELLQELAAYTFKVQAQGISITSSEDIKDLIGRSPDKAVSLILAGLPSGSVMDLAALSEGLVAGQTAAHDDADAYGAADDPTAPWNLQG